MQAHIGGYEYGTVSGVHNANCAQGSVHAVGAISDTGYCYDPNGNQTKSTRRADAGSQRLIYYTVFDKPSQIDSLEVGGPGHSTKYGYGPAREMAYRIDVPLFAGSSALASVEVQYFGGVERELRKLGAGLTKETYKRMIGGVMQIVEERTVNESTTTVTVANATIKSEVMLKDHLGSTHVIINSDGTDPQYQRFDVWGMRADAGTGSTQSLPQAYQSNNPNDASKTRTRKGFTGHEMVDGAGIVHMQGRIYDPRLGRFLQADPIIQDPLNAQNYNRYTYVYNNPLSLTDPSGYRSLSANLELYWKPVATIAIAVITQQYAAAAKIAGATLATQAAIVATGGAVIGLVNTGTLRGTVTGAFDSLLTFGIGQGFKGSWQALVIAHSLKGGMLEAMNGGDFGHGFATAGLSKIVGFGVDTLEVGDPLKIVIQSLAGGTVSAASGDGFANGAVSAALQFAFNQALSGSWTDNLPPWMRQLVVNGTAGESIISNGEMIEAQLIHEVSQPPSEEVKMIASITPFGAATVCAFDGCGWQQWAMVGVSAIPGAGAGGNVTKNTTRVGRWMGNAEHTAMASSGLVQAPFNGAGAMHVTVPPNPAAFKPPLQSSYFVEFDVPTSQLNIHDAGNGWGRVFGPGSLEARLAAFKGLPVPAAMPAAKNIRVKTP